jgi:hypothetical protein
MAIKKGIVLLLGLLLWEALSAAQTQEKPVEEIFLIKSRQDSFPFAPAKIRIGLEAAQKSYYKLIREEDVVQAGLFLQGFNSLALPASTVLEKSGKYVYSLELKTETEIVRYEVILDVIFEREEIQKRAPPTTETSEHTISLFIDNQWIASRKKILERELPLPEELPPLPPNYDPFNPDPMDNPFVNSVSIFQAAGLAYKIIKDLIDKKKVEERVPPIQKTNQISVDFLRKNLRGTDEIVEATVHLTTRYLKSGRIDPRLFSY